MPCPGFGTDVLEPVDTVAGHPRVAAELELDSPPPWENTGRLAVARKRQRGRKGLVMVGPATSAASEDER